MAVTTTPALANIIGRFMSYVQLPDDLQQCWLWQGGKTHPSSHGQGGYGKFCWSVDGLAHRAAYILFRGPIPEGMTVDHQCNNPACVHPDHLELATHRQNILRGNSMTAINARKTHCKRGHPLSGDNLGVQKGTGRFCRTCRRADYRRFPQRQREAA